MSTYKRRAGDPPDGSWLPKDQLVDGEFYVGKCRNAVRAQWLNGRFHYRRCKFGNWFVEDIPCPEDDQGYDVFFAFQPERTLPPTPIGPTDV